ncbi:MAG: protein tyrosine phosphatase [Lachnospiraceae bacterium]|nr:protein tyrosine phosphatase [Lachnospiraceae bacterium]
MKTLKKWKCHTEWNARRNMMIDVHAHILPGVDDGARDLEETSCLLRFIISQGFGAVIATPHDFRRGQGPDYERLAGLARQAEQEIRKDYPDFRIYLGQETRYHEELAERLRAGKAFTLAGSRYVLIEFEPEDSYERLFRGIRTLSFAGFFPVLAHMERYRCLHEEEHIRELAGTGCVFQMNYESLQGAWWEPEIRWCRKQVQQKRIHLLGTDMHRRDYRPPDIAGAMKWLEKNVEKKLLMAMARENALHIIRNEGMD